MDVKTKRAEALEARKRAMEGGDISDEDEEAAAAPAKAVGKKKAALRPPPQKKVLQAMQPSTWKKRTKLKFSPPSTPVASLRSRSFLKTMPPPTHPTLTPTPRHDPPNAPAPPLPLHRAKPNLNLAATATPTSTCLTSKMELVPKKATRSATQIFQWYRFVHPTSLRRIL